MDGLLIEGTEDLGLSRITEEAEVLKERCEDT